MIIEYCAQWFDSTADVNKSYYMIKAKVYRCFEHDVQRDQCKAFQ